MSVEAFNRSENSSGHEEKVRAIELATESVARLRALIAEIEQRLGLEQTAQAFDAAMVKYLEKRLQELTAELEDALAFLEEFDPHLYQRLKDIS